MQRPEVRGVLKAVDATAGRITVAVAEARQPATERSFTLAKDVEVAIGDATPRRTFVAFREGKLSDLVAGCTVTLALAADEQTVDSILAEGPMVRAALKRIDTATNTLTVTIPPTQRDQVAEDKSYTLAHDAEVGIDDGRGRRFSVKEGRTSDLAPGATLSQSKPSILPRTR